jgi:AhpD family alkylhydroperoxidase
MAAFDRIKLHQNAFDVLQGFQAIEETGSFKSLDRMLGHLVRLRASQINGCGFCVIMHTTEAREDGETDARIDRISVWREVTDYTAAERAAFAWTEALTKLEDPALLPDLHKDLARYYSPAEIAQLTGVIAMINVWNRIQVAAHGGSLEAMRRDAA